MKNIKIIIVIIIIAAILRIAALDKYPAGFNADEASIGYNAYSLIQTGKDEYGTPWPLTFKSFGDYKPGFYFYLSLPYVATLGLNEWAVRLPSAMLGVGTVILVFFLAKEIFKNRWVGVLSSFLLAISPWHLHFSRGGWETNAATFFITLGVLLFVKGLIKSSLMFWSMLSFLASMYIYQSPRFTIPIFLIFLGVLYRQRLTLILSSIIVKNARVFIGSLLAIALLITPLVFQFTSGQGGARFQGLSFLADSGPVSRVNELRGEHQNLNSFWAKLLHNKLTYGLAFLGHWLDHFRPDFLFINGDPIARNKVPEAGQFYLIEALFLAVGLISLVKLRFEHTKLLLAWILTAPLASSMTFQTPHALRALSMVIPLTVVMGFGLWVMGNWAKRFGRIIVIIFITIITIILSFEFVHYLESYYVHYPKRYPLAWEYGFSEMISKLSKYEDLYNKVVITDRYDQPYILVLFYQKYDPKKYQPQAKLTERDKFNFGTVRGFDKYEFRSINPEEIGKSENTLFIGTDKEIPKNAKILDKVNFPNGQPAFVFAKGGSR